MTWTAARLRGSAATLHQFTPPARAERTLRVLDVDSAAIVIGSSQAVDDVDPRSAVGHGVEIVRRRSGGGAVLLVPGRHEWIDFWLPAGDPLWSDDVVAAAEWLGEAFAAALGDAGLGGLSVYCGPASDDALSRTVCFLGSGPGEVFCGGRKIVGVAQRRTRDWIRFQTIMHRRFSAELTADLVVALRRADMSFSDVVQCLHSRVFEIGDLQILDLLNARLR